MNFNDYAQDYASQIDRAVPWVGRKHDIFVAEKALQLKELAHRRLGNIGQLRVLDVGCGIGLMEGALSGQFGRLVGVDIANDALEQAKLAQTHAEFLHYDGDVLPFADEAFDIAFAVCVFHHVPMEQRLALVQEMSRVVSRDGLIVIFEHNPLNPVTRLIVSRCEFDRDAVLLGCGETGRLLVQAGLERLEKRHILYFPWRSRIWTFIEYFLSWLPLGAQYYVAAGKATHVTVPRPSPDEISTRHSGPSSARIC